MENYKKMFEEANQAMIKQAKMKILIVKLIMWTIVPIIVWIGIILFLCGGYTKVIHTLQHLDQIEAKLFFFLLIVLAACFGIVSMIVPMCSFGFLKKSLHKQANDFASTVYFPDVLSALETKFTLTDEFKIKFKSIIEADLWLNNNLTFGTNGFILDYKNNEKKLLEINHEGDKYYISSFYHSSTFMDFIFIFDKVDTEGNITRATEILLPIKKK
jgi:hypothetical protein